MTSVSALQSMNAFLASLDEQGAMASRPLRRQRAWALREALLFAAARAEVDVRSGVPLTPEQREAASAGTGRVHLDDLFADEFVDDWLTHADAALRGAAEPNVATQRARMASLRALASFSGREQPAHRHPKPVLRGLLTEPEIASALQALTVRLPGRGPDDHVRLAAILSVMSVWPVRSAELSRMRLSEVRMRGSEVVLQVGADGEEQPILRGVAAERMRQWLDVRESLVSALLGGPVYSLWTSIRSNSRPGGPRGSLPLPPGMPLKPRGLQRAYARSVEGANALHAGLPGYPLPRSLDLLRRSITNTHP